MHGSPVQFFLDDLHDIEELQQVDAFAYEITLRRIYKNGEQIIKVWRKNDPNDQSDEANVLSFISPQDSLPLLS